MLRKKIKDTLVEVSKVDKGKKRKGWGDEEWQKGGEKGKKEVRKELRRWRKEEGNEKKYRINKLRYKRLCEEKKKGR